MGDSENFTAATGICLYVLALKACICGTPKILVCLFTCQIEVLTRFTVLTGMTLVGALVDLNQLWKRARVVGY